MKRSELPRAARLLSRLIPPGDRGPRLQRQTDPAPVAMDRGTAADEFRLRDLVIRFQRDANRKVIALIVDAGRVRDIKFTKR